MDNKIKIRIEEHSNYRAVWCNGKTLRFQLDKTKPITNLTYPEFYDIKLTNKCPGRCRWCYQDSIETDKHYIDVEDKLRNFFSSMDSNQLPFQVAIGGGEPTLHPKFTNVLKLLKEEFDICPNYTTNGMWVVENEQFKTNILENTLKYCGGVAVSCHPHLSSYWRLATRYYLKYKIKLDFHIIISDKKSIDYYNEIYNQYKDVIEYFVLLPYTGEIGRAPKKELDWEYLTQVIDRSSKKIAFGANFYPYLLKDDLDMNISLYEPEILSKYLDLKDMSLYPSSFNLKKIN